MRTRPWVDELGSESALRFAALRGVEVESKRRGGEEWSGVAEAWTAGATTSGLMLSLPQEFADKGSSMSPTRLVYSFAN